MRYLETYEDIVAYIERSNLTEHAKYYYGITGFDFDVLFGIARERGGLYNALDLAYNLGRARGYRAAKIGK